MALVGSFLVPFRSTNQILPNIDAMLVDFTEHILGVGIAKQRGSRQKMGCLGLILGLFRIKELFSLAHQRCRIRFPYNDGLITASCCQCPRNKHTSKHH